MDSMSTGKEQSVSLLNLGNIGDLSKPATVLIERVSDGIGGLARPWQTRRVAKAEAEAAKIAVLADIEITEIQRRAQIRLIREEGIKQQNMEHIVAGALPELSSGARPEDIDNDWFAHFFERSRIVSDSQMQSLWSRILAGEANAPGSFSKRTLDTVATLEKSEAALFTQLCAFCWRLDEDVLTPFVFDDEHPVYTDHGITFDTLMHLNNIGLVTFTPAMSVSKRKLPNTLKASYFDKAVELVFPDDYHLDIGNVIFTKTGEELAPIAGAAPVDQFFQYVVSHWREMNLIKGDWSAERL
jgi:Protein of unknown function (DUF2806)